MRKTLNFCCAAALMIIFSNKTVHAQFISDFKGYPILTIKYTDVEGSPFLFEDWTKGVVKLANGKTYSDVLLKYDLVADQLLFKDLKSDQALEFIDPLVEFKLQATLAGNNDLLLFRNGYMAANGQSTTSFYKVLFDGGTQLLKRNEKRITETKEYSSASIVKKFDESETYYLSRNKEVIKIKKDKAQVLSALVNHTDKLEQHIKAQKLNLKNEADLVKLIAYFNTL